MDSFQPLFERLRATIDHIEKGNEQFMFAMSEMRAVIDAALQARSEHEDVRETIARLEALIAELMRRLNGH